VPGNQQGMLAEISHAMPPLFSYHAICGMKEVSPQSTGSPSIPAHLVTEEALQIGRERETAVQANPNQMAVGADDQYVRLWDRRMLSTGIHDCTIKL